MQSGEKAFAQLAFVRADRVPADRLDVLDRSDEAGQQLVRERARLEAVAERLVGRRPDLVRPPRLEQLRPAEREPEMRPEVLVRRADEDVDAPVRDVDRAVRAVVDGVGPGERAGVVCEFGDAADVGAGADGVGGNRERDDARAVREFPLEILEIERRVVLDLDEADDEALVVR